MANRKVGESLVKFGHWFLFRSNLCHSANMPLAWTPHPILETPSQEEQIAMGPERLLEYYERREAAIMDFQHTDLTDNPHKLAKLAGEIAAIDRVLRVLQDD